MNKQLLTICCACDKTYLKYFTYLYKSILINHPNCNIILRYVDDDLSLCDSIDSRVHIIHDKTPLSNKRNILCRGIDDGYPRMKEPSLRSIFMSERSCYCAHSKFLNAKQLLDEDYQTILIMDVDAVVRRDLSDLVDIIRNCDFTIRSKKRKNDKIVNKNYPIFKEGVMGINNTPSSKMFFTKVYNQICNIRKTDKYDFDTDSLVIGKVFFENKDNVRYTKLPFTYKDTEYNDSSVIW